MLCTQTPFAAKPHPTTESLRDQWRSSRSVAACCCTLQDNTEIITNAPAIILTCIVQSCLLTCIFQSITFTNVASIFFQSFTHHLFNTLPGVSMTTFTNSADWSFSSMTVSCFLSGTVAANMYSSLPPSLNWLDAASHIFASPVLTDSLPAHTQFPVFVDLPPVERQTIYPWVECHLLPSICSRGIVMPKWLAIDGIISTIPGFPFWNNHSILCIGNDPRDCVHGPIARHDPARFLRSRPWSVVI